MDLFDDEGWAEETLTWWTKYGALPKHARAY
jgi:hypothetical protein